MELEQEIKEYIQELTKGCYEEYMLLLNKVCIILNLKYFECDFEDSKISGQIEKEDGLFKIYVNRKHPLTRKRFTIAHEIGHYISFLKKSYSEEQLKNNTSHEDYAISYRKKDVCSKAETEANQIAAEMLMPEDKVRELMDKNLTPEEMADIFYVSPSAMTIRLEQIYPNLIIV